MARDRIYFDKFRFGGLKHVSFWRSFYSLRIIMAVSYMKETAFVYRTKAVSFN